MTALLPYLVFSVITRSDSTTLVHRTVTEDVVHYNTCIQGGHGTGKTGNLAVNFSRQGKHREFSKFNFLHRENCGNTGKILKI